MIPEGGIVVWWVASQWGRVGYVVCGIVKRWMINRYASFSSLT